MDDFYVNSAVSYAGRTGTLVGLSSAGGPTVAFGAEPMTMVKEARSTVALSLKDVGRQVLIFFDAEDPDSPIIIGCICDPTAPVPTILTVESDGESIVVSAQKSLKLICGQASIKLTQAGKVEIRGTHVVSRSTGANKMKGGSVQLN